ncbi:MAG: acetylglutamate kinase, partial [Clostridia bacterium]|nr:acetylglutamate kinase [Clostridia bacterium]
IKSIDVDPILVTLENDYIPVIATVAGGEDGKIYNINADTAAAAIASALHAENLVLMTDVRGLLLDKDDESTLISEIKVSEVPKLIKKGIISGGMIPKIDCVVEAVRQGVDQAVIIDGRIKHSIIMDMLTNKGIGTLIK